MLLYLLFDAIGGAQERFNVILTDLGERVANLIFSVAESVAEKHIPGLVSLGFAIALGVALFLLARGTRHNLAALRDAEAAIASAKDEKEFSAKPDLVSDGFEKLRGRHGKAGAAVAEAWDEYKETIVVFDLDDKKTCATACDQACSSTLRILAWRLDSGGSCRGCSCPLVWRSPFSA
jgi:hypothetical protein